MQNELFTYEADGQALIIHLPKELDHHNCRNLKYETDLLMEENYINKIVFDFSNTVQTDGGQPGNGPHLRRRSENHENPDDRRDNETCQKV